MKKILRLTLLVCTLFPIGAEAQVSATEILWGVPQPYFRGVAEFMGEPGKYYELERTTDLLHWSPLPQIFRGNGQPIRQVLHPDFYPDVASWVTPSTPQIVPADVLQPLLPVGLNSTAQSIETILQVKSVDRNHTSFRQLDMALSVQLRNRGTQPLSKVQLNLPLQLAFSHLVAGASPPAVVELLPAPTVIEGSVNLNSAFGFSDTRLLAGTDTLNPGTTCAIQVTLRFTFAAGWAFPRTPRYLFAVASAGASASTNPGVGIQLSGTTLQTVTLTPQPGAATYECSGDLYTWLPLGTPNLRRSTSIYFYNRSEVFSRWYNVTSFADGGALVAWWSPVEEAQVAQYFPPGYWNSIDLRKPTNLAEYYSGYTEIYRTYPCPSPGVTPVPDLPTFGCPTNIEITVGAHPSRHAAASTAVAAATPPQSEFLAMNLFTSQLATIKAQIIAQSLANPPAHQITPNPQDPNLLALSDRDLTKKTNEFFRLRRCDLDSNFNGTYDSAETNDDWWLDLDDDDDGIPNGYDTLPGPGNAVGTSILINEVCADNGGNLKTAPHPITGDISSPDWVELYNPTSGLVDLSGWQLRDTSNKYYTFGAAATIPAKGFLIVFCMGDNDAVDVGSEHRARFAISSGADGEAVTLFNAVGALVDGTPTPGPQYRDVTYGRFLNPRHAAGVSPLTWGYLSKPTPMAHNSSGYTGQAADPDMKMRDVDTDAEVFPGVYSRSEHRALKLVLTGGGQNTSLHYTTNCADPTGWSPIYDPANPPTFDRTVIIKAAAVGRDMLPSKIVVQTYIFKESVVGPAVGDPLLLPGSPPITVQTKPAYYPEFSTQEYDHGSTYNGVPIPYGVSATVAAQNRAAIMAQLSALPSLSVVIPVADFLDRDSAGIYACSYNTSNPAIDPRCTGWERVTSFEWLHPENGLPVGASRANVHCSITMSGNTNLDWWRTEKHSLTLSFKRELGASKYDPKFKPFPQELEVKPKYDNLILRNPTFDCWPVTTGLPSDTIPAQATYAKDVYARNTLTALGSPQLYHRWVHLYVNGLYWGAYMLTERADQDTCQRRFGAGDYYVWKDAKGEQVGDNLPAQDTAAVVWAKLMTDGAAVRLKSTSVTPQDAASELAVVENEADLNSFVDYAVFHAFLGNFDAMTNNGRVYKKMPSGKFTWWAYDIEVGAAPNFLTRNCFTSYWWAESTAPKGPLNSEARLLYDLTRYPKFAQRFGDRAWQLCLMPSNLQTRLSDGALTGDTSAGKAQTRFAAAAADFDAIRLSEALRWGAGYRGGSASSPLTTTGTPYVIGMDTPLTYPGGFLAARRTYFQSQLQSLGLLSTVPLPTLTAGSAPNTWILAAPTLAGSQTYYNADGIPADPDGPGLSTTGTLVVAGTPRTLTAPFHLTARVRSSVPAGTTDDTPLWSNLFDIELPLHP